MDINTLPAPLKQKPPPPFEHTLSGLAAWIEAALEDLIRVEQSKHYTVFMDSYFSIRDGRFCGVCFAGSVMIGRYYDAVADAVQQHSISGLGVNNVNPNGRDFETMMDLLDDIRSGDLTEAVEYWMDADLDYELYTMLRTLEDEYVEYETKPSAFKQWCRDVIKTLRKNDKENNEENNDEQ